MVKIIWTKIYDRLLWVTAYLQYWLAKLLFFSARVVCTCNQKTRYKSFLWGSIYPPSVVEAVESKGQDLFDVTIDSMRMVSYMRRINKVASNVSEMSSADREAFLKDMRAKEIDIARA